MSRDDVPWLEPDERRDWIAVMAMLELLPAALDAQLRADAGCNLFEYHLLAMLSDAPDRSLPMQRLALLSQGSLSRVSHAVSRLERAGWLERCPDPAGGRSTFVALTDHGVDHLEAVAPGHVREVRRLVLDVLPAGELARFGRIARRLLAEAFPDVAEAVAEAGEP